MTTAVMQALDGIISLSTKSKRMLRSLPSNLGSDGCASEFRSQFAFYMMTKFDRAAALL